MVPLLAPSTPRPNWIFSPAVASTYWYRVFLVFYTRVTCFMVWQMRRLHCRTRWQCCHWARPVFHRKALGHRTRQKHRPVARNGQRRAESRTPRDRAMIRIVSIRQEEMMITTVYNSQVTVWLSVTMMWTMSGWLSIVLSLVSVSFTSQYPRWLEMFCACQTVLNI